jgi:hypothetical protein
MERHADGLEDNFKNVTAEEVSRLTKAMKDKQFQSHMDEYCQEISDPKHRKEYLQYLDQLEAKGEMPEGQVLLRTEPGVCVKTTISFKNGQTQKCFINIVHSDRIRDMSEDDDGKGGKNVSMPYSLGPPRPERDNKGENCMTADFAVGTWTFGQAIQRPNVLKMLVDTASEGLQGKFLKGHEEVKKDFKVMRRIQCRGPGARPIPMSVKGELLKDGGKSNKPVMSSVAPSSAVTPSELREMRKEAKDKMLKPKKTDDTEEDHVPKQIKEEVSFTTASGATRIRVPKHKLIHSGCYDLTDFMECSGRPTQLAQSVPKLLKLVVELPTVKKGSDVSLDVTSDNICIEVPDKYYLDLPLSYEIDEEKGAAKFDKVAQTLTLELPVKPKLPDPNSFANRIGFVTEEEGDTADADDDELVDEGENLEEDLPPLEETLDSVEVEPASADSVPDVQQAPAPAAVEKPQPKPSPNDEDFVPEAELVPFIAADAFQGKRQGYYFGTGEEGLGYYRDVRQKRPTREQDSNPSNFPSESIPDVVKSSSQIKFKVEREEIAKETGAPLIEEIDEVEKIKEFLGPNDFTPAVSSSKKPAERAELSKAVQTYVDVTTLLTSRIPASEIDHGRGVLEPSVAWHQTRQNLILSLGLSAGLEVAGLQLSFVGRRLTISFCTRPVGTIVWCQNRVRRTLCRGVDPLQWHADPPQRDTDECSSMVIVLRKTDYDRWVEAFDASAPVEVREPIATVDDEDFADTSISDSLMQARNSSTHGTADTAAGEDIDVVVEDSAELDAAAPTVHGAPELEGTSTSTPMPAKPWNAAAANAAAQSATVMGQAVLLRTRLMYQLF